jgi:hypothetical protein
MISSSACVGTVLGNYFEEENIPEQTEARTSGFATEVGSLFEMWGYADGRECLSVGLSERGAEEMALRFGRAEVLLGSMASSTPPKAPSASAPPSSWGTRKSSPGKRVRSASGTRRSSASLG